MEDSLILDTSDLPPRPTVRKQTSPLFSDSPFFLSKRTHFETPINDTTNTLEISELTQPHQNHLPNPRPLPPKCPRAVPSFIESSAIEPSSLHLSGQRASKPPQDFSFQSLSLQENDPSIINDVAATVNFDGISLSGINDSSVSETHLSAAEADIAAGNEPINPADLSYEALLRWEERQGGVLDDRWSEMRESVMRVALICLLDDRNWR